MKRNTFHSGMKIERALSNKILRIVFVWKKFSLRVDLNVLSAFLFGQPTEAAVSVLLSFKKREFLHFIPSLISSNCEMR